MPLQGKQKAAVWSKKFFSLKSNYITNNCSNPDKVYRAVLCILYVHTTVNVYLKHFAGTALHQIILCSPYLICLCKAKRREGKPGSDLSLKCSLIYWGRSDLGGEECWWWVLCHKQVISRQQLGWVKLQSTAGQQRPRSLEELNKMRGWTLSSGTALSRLFADIWGQSGEWGREAPPSWRFYNGLSTIGFTIDLHDLRGVLPIWTGSSESGPALLS